MAKIFIIISIDTQTNEWLENHSIICIEEWIVHGSIAHAKLLKFGHFFIDLEHFCCCHLTQILFCSNQFTTVMRTMNCTKKYNKFKDEPAAVECLFLCLLFIYIRNCLTFLNICLKLQVHRKKNEYQWRPLVKPNILQSMKKIKWRRN